MQNSSRRNRWKRIVLVGFILSVAVSVSSAQLAVIRDKDGYTNIREKPSLESKVLGRIYEGDIFYYWEDKDAADWVGVGHEIGLDKMSQKEREHYLNTIKANGNNINISGFIHKSRLRTFDKMTEIKSNREFQQGVLRIVN